MLLSAGDKLGPYEILAPLGAWNADGRIETLRKVTPEREQAR